MSPLETLKTELREFIALSKAITPGKWEAFQRNEEIGTNYFRITFSDRRSDSLCGYCGEPNAAFIARSRNISPTMAKMLLAAVEGLELHANHGQEPERGSARYDLNKILKLWEETK
jgi:hypothetical protein